MDWTTLVSNLGFPIVLSIYLLVVTTKKLDAFTTAIMDLTQSIKTMVSSNQHDHDDFLNFLSGRRHLQKGGDNDG